MIINDNLYDLERSEKIIRKFCKLTPKAEVEYVCTTDLRGEEFAYDIFYITDKELTFYKGIYKGSIVIEADIIEELTFTMIRDSKGHFHYSQHRHDFRTVDTGSIDGGRSYTKLTGTSKSLPETIEYKIMDGAFVCS